MKVVILHTDFRIYWPARIKALDALLRTKGITLDIIEIAGAGSPYSFAERNAQDSLSWHILFPSKQMEDLSNSLVKSELFKMLNQLRPDVLIAGAIAFPSGALAIRWAKKYHKKVIIFDDSKYNDVKRNNIVNYIKQSVYNGVDAMFYPSAEWLLTGEYWHFKAEQIFYGVDVVDNKFWQQTININKVYKERYFIFVGRQIEVKNLLFLLQAYKNYRSKVVNPYNLVLIGDGPQRKKILSYIISNALEGVKLYPFKQQSELIPFFRNAEALILPSLRETWGLVVNEAMASGLPILISKNCGAAGPLVQNGKNGFVFSPYNLQDLVTKMILFHQLSSCEKKEMSTLSLRIIQNWGVDKFATSLLDAIKYVVQKPESRLSIIDKFIINSWSGQYRPI